MRSVFAPKLWLEQNLMPINQKEQQATKKTQNGVDNIQNSGLKIQTLSLHSAVESLREDSSFIKH